MKLKLDTFIGIVLTGVVIAFGCAWLTSWVTASVHDKNKEPTAQGAHFHITAADGTKTVAQLALEQAEGLRPGNGVVCRLYISNSVNHSTIVLPTIAGHDPNFEFGIGPGQVFDFPLTKQQDVALNEIPVRTNGIANAYFYWEFCR